MQKKCAYCKEIIDIDIDNIQGVAYFKSQYYHSQCLLNIAAERAKKKRHAAYWDTMENDIVTYEVSAKQTIMNIAGKDMLNEHILMHYNVVAVPQRLWEILSDLGNGKYKSKKCRPVSSLDIYGTWAWGQSKLDETAKYNKANHKGPENDDARILYDLAIVISKVPVYWKYKEKQVANANEIHNINVQDNIDLSKISKIKSRKKESIGDIFDDLYVE